MDPVGLHTRRMGRCTNHNGRLTCVSVGVGLSGLFQGPVLPVLAPESWWAGCGGVGIFPGLSAARYQMGEQSFSHHMRNRQTLSLDCLTATVPDVAAWVARFTVAS